MLWHRIGNFVGPVAVDEKRFVSAARILSGKKREQKEE